MAVSSGGQRDRGLTPVDPKHVFALARERPLFASIPEGLRQAAAGTHARPAPQSPPKGRSKSRKGPDRQQLRGIGVSPTALIVDTLPHG